MTLFGVHALACPPPAIHRLRLLMVPLLLLLLCALSARAADPSYSAQLDFFIPVPVTNVATVQPDVCAFEKTFTNHVHTMAQGRLQIPPEPLPNTTLAWGCIAAAALALAMRFLGPRAVIWFTKEGQALIALALHPESLRAEEKSFSEFANSFKVGSSTTDPAEARKQEELQVAEKVLKQAAADIGKLRKLFGQLGPKSDANRQGAVLAEFCEELRQFKAPLDLPTTLPLWTLTLALEGLLKQFQLRIADMTPSALRTAATAIDTLGWLAAQRVTNDVFGSPPVRLLVVDDEPISLRAVTHALKQSFPQPDTAANGDAGFALAEQNPYDVIFLDVEMPGIDGFELCSKIRQTARNRETPVVFVTSHADFNSRAKAPLKGAQDLIAKPFLKFEITVKALTLILRYRLRVGPQPASAHAMATSAQARPKTLGIAKKHTVPPPPWMQAARAKALANATTTAADPKPSASPAIDPAAAGKPEHFRNLNRQLEAIGSAETVDIRQNVLGDVRLSLSILGEQAARSGRNGAFKLCCIAETLVAKVIDDPEKLQRSTLGAIAATIELLEQLFTAARQPKLDELPRIMIVDDDPLTRRALSGALQLALGKPTSVEDGETAVAMARQHSFDLIFMDVRMPGMGGFEAAMRIREIGCNPKTQIVFVTSRSDQEFRDQAGRAGASAFITKPFVVSEITLTALAFCLRTRLPEMNHANTAEPAPALV
jgi:CheY-like chemotaxis protein